MSATDRLDEHVATDWSVDRRPCRQVRRFCPIVWRQPAGSTANI